MKAKPDRWKRARHALWMTTLAFFLSVQLALAAGTPTFVTVEGDPDGVLSRGETWQIRGIVTLSPGEELFYEASLIGGLRVQGEVRVTSPGLSQVIEGGVSGNVRVRADGGEAGGQILIDYLLVAPSPCWPGGVNTASHTGSWQANGASLGSTSATLPAEFGQVGTAVGLSKDDGGVTAERGAVLAYTVEWASIVTANLMPDVAVRETVPTWTRFDAGASSPGWSCASDGGPGDLCTLELGDVTCLSDGGGTRGSSTFAVVVDPATPAAVTEITNGALALVDGTIPSGTATEVTPLRALAPDLVLSMTGPTTGAPGETLTYELRATNAGTGTATETAVEAAVPEGMVYVGGGGWGAACPPGAVAGSLCRRPLGNIAEGASASATLRLRPEALPAAGRPPIEVSGRATLSQTDPTPANNLASLTTAIEGGTPDLVLSVTPATQGAGLGAAVGWTWTVRNAGSRGATGLTLTDAHPPQLVPGGTLSAGGTCTLSAGLVQTCTRPVLEVGETWAVEVTAQLAETLPAPVPSEISSAGAVTDDGSHGPDPTPGNNRAEAGVTVELGPDDGAVLRVEKIVEQSEALPAAALDYTVTIRNTGNLGSDPVRVEDRIPEGTRLTGGPSWSCAGSTEGELCAFERTTLAPGESQVLGLQVTVLDDPIPLVPEILNRAELFEAGVIRDIGEVRVPLELRPGDGPDLVMSKRASAPTVGTGETLVWTLGVENAGNLPAVGLVSDTMPEEVEVITSQGVACFDGGADPWLCVASVTLAPGESWEATVTTRVLEPLAAGTVSLSNTAEVTVESSLAPDVDPSNNSATARVDLEIGNGSGPDMAVTLEADRDEVLPGELLTYRITADALGTIGSTGVELLLQRPTGTIWVEVEDGSCWSFEGDEARCRLGTAQVGDSWGFLVPVAVEAMPTVAAVDARVEVIADVDGDPTNNVATTRTPIGDLPPPPLPDLEVRWIAGEPVYPGELLEWTLVLTHLDTGEVEATGVRVEASSSTHDLAALIRLADGAECAGGVCAWTVPTLAPGESRSWSIQVEAPDATVMTVVAEASSMEPDLRPDDNRASSSIEILSRGGLETVSFTLFDVPGMGSAYRDLLEAQGFEGPELAGIEVIEYHVTLHAPEGLRPSTVAALGEALSPPEHLLFLEGSLAVPLSFGVREGRRLPVLDLPALAAGESLTWTFAAFLPPDTSAAVQSVQWQLRLTDEGGGAVPSDDPDTGEAGDPTVTGFRDLGGVPEVPSLGQFGLLVLALLLGWIGVKQISGRWVLSW